MYQLCFMLVSSTLWINHTCQLYQFFWERGEVYADPALNGHFIAFLGVQGAFQELGLNITDLGFKGLKSLGLTHS